MFSSKIQTYAGYNGPNDAENPDFKLSLVVVGPIDSDCKVSTVNQIIEIHSRSNKYFVKGSIMIIFQPLEVEGKDISNSFANWTPESIEYWKSSNSLSKLNAWLGHHQSEIVDDNHNYDDEEDSDEESTISVDERNSDKKKAITIVKCGDLKCKFALKIYEYKGYYENVETVL
ncbi:uncharacterized protein [Dysidea avara]|uniref:uncharacterized protein isoform X2 n=1 Tax=Dysidea avara TaxID=196820 RepID=UPI00332E0CF1